jgi:hypothetical protein
MRRLRLPPGATRHYEMCQVPDRLGKIVFKLKTLLFAVEFSDFAVEKKFAFSVQIFLVVSFIIAIFAYGFEGNKSE